MSQCLVVCPVLFLSCRVRINDGLKKGDLLVFEVSNNFIVDYYDGKKSIVVSNTNDLGGRNLYWGQSLPIIGAIVLVLALVIAVSARIAFDYIQYSHSRVGLGRPREVQCSSGALY